MDSAFPASSANATSIYGSIALNHEDKRKSTLVSLWLLASLSFLFLAARLLCKVHARRGFWWDDYVMSLSWTCLVASVVTSTFSVTKGEGLHLWDVPPQNLALIGLLGNLAATFSILGTIWSKSSFALTLLRLVSSPPLRRLLWLAIVSLHVFMGLNAVFLWVRCLPLVKTWDPATPGTCWAPQIYPIYGIFSAAYSAVLDFVLAMLPWKIVWRLNLQRGEKLGVAIAMSLGVVAGATAIVKTSQIPTLASGDFTFASIPLIVWGAAETAVTIMAASLPVLRVLLRNMHVFTLRPSRLSTAAAADLPDGHDRETILAAAAAHAGDLLHHKATHGSITITYQPTVDDEEAVRPRDDEDLACQRRESKESVPIFLATDKADPFCGGIR